MASTTPAPAAAPPQPAAAAVTPVQAPARPRPRAPRPAPRGSTRARVHSTAQAADGLLMGLIAYAIAINYIRGGWSGVADWGRAKFFNEPSQGAAPAAGHNTGSGTGGGGSSGGLGQLGDTLGNLPSILKTK